MLLVDPGEIAKMVQIDGPRDEVCKAMKKVVEMMDDEERKKAIWDPEKLIERLEEVDEMREYYMEGLPEILEMFGFGKLSFHGETKI